MLPRGYVSTVAKLSRDFGRRCKLHRNRIAAVVLVLLLTLLTGALSVAAKTTEIVILHNNDLHGRIDGIVEDGEDRGSIARMAGMANVIRAMYPGRVLWFDGGDTTHGTTVANLFFGASVIDAYNAAGIDAMAAGNHDYNYGYEVLLMRALQADFPIFAANAVYKDTGESILPSHKFFDVDGLRIAVFGFSPVTTPVTTHPKNVADLTFLDPLEVAAELVPKLREEADLVFAVNHIGYDLDLKLAEAVPGIDVIVGGHSHTQLDYPVQVGDTIIVQAHEYGRYLGFVKLVVEDGRVVSHEGRLLPTTADMPVDLGIQAVVDSWEDRLSELLDEEIGFTTVHLDGERVDSRTRETNLGNLVADAMRQTLDADLALTNGGGIRASVPAGIITLRDAYSVLPFDNTLAGIEASGAAIVAALEHGVSRWPVDWGGFLQVSGISFAFNPNNEPGERVIKDSVKVNGEPIDLDRIYRVATNDFLAAGGDSYTMLGGLNFFHGSATGDGDFLRDVFAAIFDEVDTVAPEVEGRIVIVED